MMGISARAWRMICLICSPSDATRQPAFGRRRHYRHLWIILVVAIGIPGSASSQSICEGLTTILTSTRADLEFQTVPGAICKRSGSALKCIWQKPGPPAGMRLRQWVNTAIMPDIKKLSAAIRQCIREESIPYSWNRFKKDKTSSGFVKGYFVQQDNSARRPRTIGICFEHDDDEVGAGVVLSIQFSPKGKSYCRW